MDDAGQPRQSGLMCRLLESPRTRERGCFSSLSVAQLEYRYASQTAVWITLCLTPESESTTHLFGMLHVEGHWAPAWLIKALLAPLLLRVAHQDRKMVEHQGSQRGSRCTV